MSSRHHIDDFMRGRIIGKIEEGRKITDVAREFDIAHSFVSRLWKSFKTTGMCGRRHEGGRVRSTTPAEDRYIVLSAKRNWRTTAQQVANQFLAASGKQISRTTVARRLRGGGLYTRIPVVCVPLTIQHRTARLKWCREHHNWTEQDWACVLFSDERKGPISDMQYHGVGRHHVNGRTRLHVVANGTMTGQRYIDEVLLPHVRLFRCAVGDKFVFMDDNATCHRTLAVQDCLDSEGIQRLVWSARSPDLNPIENVWYALGRQVAGRNYPPTNKNTLIRALTEEWDKLPQQLLDNVVQTKESGEKIANSLNKIFGQEKILLKLHVTLDENLINSHHNKSDKGNMTAVAIWVISWSQIQSRRCRVMMSLKAHGIDKLSDVLRVLEALSSCAKKVLALPQTLSIKETFLCFIASVNRKGAQMTFCRVGVTVTEKVSNCYAVGRTEESHSLK
ncbi:transposable element Tcb2 transposase [Trichonephila clavipes]|nr:transposable element Tcb2 transposase [Trichonephila clavipes]